ncbi:MAG: hypothetical protein QOH09_2262 [Pseudonocardiales bacterium]|nr:hypothetical protein [Pseudonocardiales bacterium]
MVHAAPPPAAQTPIRLATPPHTTITLPTAREPATTPRTSHPCPHRSLPAIRFLIRLVIAIRPCWSSRRAWRQYSKDLSSTLASLWTQSCPLVGRGPRDRLLGAMSRTQPAVVSAVRFESAGWSCRSFGDGRGLDGAVFDRQPSDDRCDAPSYARPRRLPHETAGRIRVLRVPHLRAPGRHAARRLRPCRGSVPGDRVWCRCNPAPAPAASVPTSLEPARPRRVGNPAVSAVQ